LYCRVQKRPSITYVSVTHSRRRPDGSVLSAKTDTHKIYFHKLGTKQSEDQLIIGGENFKRRYLSASVSDDQRFLIISAANATNGNELYIKDLKKKTDFVPVQTGYDFNTNVVDTKGDIIYAITDKNAPNKKIVKFNINNPNSWTEVVPEKENAVLFVQKSQIMSHMSTPALSILSMDL